MLRASLSRCPPPSRRPLSRRATLTGLVTGYLVSRPSPLAVPVNVIAARKYCPFVEREKNARARAAPTVLPPIARTPHSDKTTRDIYGDDAQSARE